jgi:hypothetical protein
MNRPGTIIANRNFPIEKRANDAKITPRALGGIIMSRPALPMMGPRVIGGLYPLFSISGNITVPNMATLAVAAPESAPKTAPPKTVRRLNLPGTRPIHLSRVSIIRGATPVLNMTSPIKIKRGIGSMLKLMDPYRLKMN